MKTLIELHEQMRDLAEAITDYKAMEQRYRKPHKNPIQEDFLRRYWNHKADVCARASSIMKVSYLNRLEQINELSKQL